MGFVGKIFKTIFNPSVSPVSAPTTTARDLVSSTSSQEPTEAVMGDSLNKKKRTGISSLLVPSESTLKGGA